MERTLIGQLTEKIGEEVMLKVYLKHNRDLGGVTFLIVEDRTGKAQVVLERAELLELVKNLHFGSVLEIYGKVAKSKSRGFPVEVVAGEIKILCAVNEVMPVDLERNRLKISIDTELDHRSLTLQHEENKAIFKIQARLVQAYREYMISLGATEFFGPAIIGASSEGGAEIFRVPYFGHKATLAQSSQLYKQTLVKVFERVFAVAKCFRAENSNTRRHLTEATQYEFEMGFINDFNDVMEVLEGAIRFMIGAIQKDCAGELAFLKTNLPLLPEGKFPRIKFGEVKEILAGKLDLAGEKDMTTETEKMICAYTREKFGSDFVFITNFEKGVFYCYKDENGVYQNFDLLCREAEIVSGGRRIDNYEKLVASITGSGMKPADFSEYLEIFKYGMPPHGGFGLGLERSTMLFLGLDNIRKTTLFPSDPKRVAGKRVGALERILKKR